MGAQDEGAVTFSFRVLPLSMARYNDFIKAKSTPRAEADCACAAIQHHSTRFSLAIPEKDARAINSPVGPAALTFDSINPVHLLPDRQRRDAQDQQAG